MRYLRVKNLERFQPQSSKRLPWIKLMTELLEPTRQPWTTDLPDAAKALLYHVWLMASVHGGRIPEDWLTRERLNLKSKPNLDSILELGLVWFENEDGSVSEHSHARLARSGYLPSPHLVPEGGPGSSQETAFASVWFDYPRRIGRKDALRHFKASVKTPEDLARLRVALSNYRAEVEGREMRFVQHGSTWFNNWQDWESVTPHCGPARPSTAAGMLVGKGTLERLTDRIECFVEQRGKRPESGPARGQWDRDFANEFGFTPDHWNEAGEDERWHLADAAVARGAA